MSNFHYVYILVDEATGTHFYIGCTEDLKSRLEKHNKGDVPHTAKFRPWRIKNAIAFDDREKAYAFEAYLKTHCGIVCTSGYGGSKLSEVSNGFIKFYLTILLEFIREYRYITSERKLYCYAKIMFYF